MSNAIEECEGYKSLLADVVSDERNKHHDYRGKFEWIIERAKHYAEKTGLTASEILNAWESKRTYWYMNFYQECNQPKIEGDSVRVFDTVDEMLTAIGNKGFRCPHCEGVSKSPYVCDSGVLVELMNAKGSLNPCNWKVFGLFGHMGQGVFVYVKEKIAGEKLFKPIAWEVGDAALETASELQAAAGL